jgi:hypothetical protein
MEALQLVIGLLKLLGVPDYNMFRRGEAAHSHKSSATPSKLPHDNYVAVPGYPALAEVSISGGGLAYSRDQYRLPVAEFRSLLAHGRRERRLADR